MFHHRRFQRRIENFTCEHCGKIVGGTGYTNHCPHCLWSKHVDVNPGDRLALCKGLMRPTEYFQRDGRWFVRHRCETCGFERPNQLQEGDDFEVLLAIGKG